jgi:hypothetical protein
VLRAIDQNGNWHRGTVMAVQATESEENPCCSWCHLPKDRVAFLVASPTDYPRVYICDECIEVCHSVLSKRRSESQKTLRSATSKGEISPENRSELLSRLALIKREIEALEKLGK